MAQFAIHGGWKSVAALSSLLAFVMMVTYAIAMDDSLGVWPYLTGLAIVVFGFWSKEDVIAVAGILALSLLLILDILLRIGVLGFNHVKVI